MEEEVRDVAWRLFQVDEEEEPIAVIGALHESVLSTDPTRREMTPERSEYRPDGLRGDS